LINVNDRYGAIPFIIMGADEPWRQIDKAFSMQGKQKLPAGHIFKTPVWLSPIPFLAEDSGDVLSALIPMPVDGGLNGLEVSLSDGSFSDSNGYHCHCIAKENPGRQQKMHKNEKKFVGG
jgi:hypothetical protein